MWTGVMLSLVLAQAQPTVTAKSVNETRYKELTKQAFGFSFDGLSIGFEMEGPAIKEMVKYGNLKVAEAKDDKGADLIKKPQRPGDTFNSSDQPEMRVVQDYEQKQGKVSFQVSLKKTARTATKVSAKGSIDALVGGTKGEAEFAKVKALEGTQLKNADLEGLKLKVTVAKPAKSFFGKPEQMVVLEFDGDDASIIDYSLVDAAGKKVNVFPFTTMKEKVKVVTFNFDKAVPPDTKLKINYVKGAKRVTVPFEVKDVELP
jgi:hypothetical protein